MSVPAYLATVLPGLEAVAADELRAKLPGVRVSETERGKLFFHTDLRLEQLLRLRSVDNLYGIVVRLPVGPHRVHLPALTDAIAALDTLSSADAGSRGGRRTFYVNASRSGRQSYSRFEAAEAVAQGILCRCTNWSLGTPERHETEFRLDVADGRATLAVRLTPPAFRFRGRARAFSPAALRPSVAHALVWLSDPRPADRFLDPFCGSGTIAAERAAYSACRVLAGDLAAGAVLSAAKNLPEQVALMQWDARRLPLRSETIDKLVTNLPFGHQIAISTELGALYRDFGREMSRVLAPAGEALLLSDQTDALYEGLRGTGFAIEERATLSLHGLHPRVFHIRRV